VFWWDFLGVYLVEPNGRLNCCLKHPCTWVMYVLENFQSDTDYQMTRAEQQIRATWLMEPGNVPQ